MELSEINELSQQTRVDGKRLFGVAEAIYKFAISINWFIGIVGGIASVVTMGNGGAGIGFGFVIAIITLSICTFNYMIAVLSTHIAKVLVHISFASIGTLDALSKRDN